MTHRSPLHAPTPPNPFPPSIHPQAPLTPRPPPQAPMCAQPPHLPAESFCRAQPAPPRLFSNLPMRAQPWARAGPALQARVAQAGVSIHTRTHAPLGGKQKIHLPQGEGDKREKEGGGVAGVGNTHRAGWQEAAAPGCWAVQCCAVHLPESGSDGGHAAHGVSARMSACLGLPCVHAFVRVRARTTMRASDCRGAHGRGRCVPRSS
jgi:hypothetical protein